MTQAVEVVVFRAKEGISDHVLTDAAASANAEISLLDGFISRDFGAADGQFIDIVHWRDMAAAKAAAEQVMKLPTCAAFFELIDTKHMTFMHFDKVALSLPKNIWRGRTPVEN